MPCWDHKKAAVMRLFCVPRDPYSTRGLCPLKPLRRKAPAAVMRLFLVP